MSLPPWFSNWIMKPDKHLIAAACTIAVAACLIVLTWIGAMRAIGAQRQENGARITATLASEASAFSERIDRQILALDQTLRILGSAWQTDPGHFDLEAWRSQAVVLSGLSRDMILTDKDGIVRQSSVGSAVGQDASGQGFFRDLADPSNVGDSIYIGPATIDSFMRQWHMDVARALRYRDGSFAGVIDTDYRLSSITDVFSQADLPVGSFVALVGLADGKLRGAVGPSTENPDASVRDTPMYGAIRDAVSGIWTGPSATDGVERIHAFRHLPARDLAVVVALSEAEAMRPASIWRSQVLTFAGCFTALLAGLALLLVRFAGQARRREAQVAEDRADLAATNAQLEFARAMAAAKAEQLEATLAGMSDGVSMFDGNLCLVEWNSRFPEIAGVPAEILRPGLPIEEILRAQVETGQFGSASDPEPEVQRRMARLRIAPFGVAQRQRPDGHTLELRRNRLPDGGFVTLYADITEQKLAEEALRVARAAAEAANNEKSRFVAIVSHEIRTPLNSLLNTIRLLGDSALAPAQQALLAMARQSGEVLLELTSDILDMSQMEAGTLPIRPSLFELRALLESSAEMFAGQAADRGIAIHVDIAAGTPDTLRTDPNRLRQVVLNLLSNAVKYARAGDVRLTAEPARDPREAVRLGVRDGGPIIAEAARGRLFSPFSRLDRPDGESPAGTGLGLSICHDLVTLMGGKIGCDAWSANDDAGSGTSEGNVFWVTLPASALPALAEPGKIEGAGSSGRAAVRMALPAEGDLAPPNRLPPRTRILLAEDIMANQIVTATLLRRAGHHVDIAATGAAAIEAIQAAPYDLVFMDILMPGMSGQQATRIIRGLAEPSRSTPVIAVTATAGPEDEAVFRAAGMDGILAKPVSIAELLDALRRHVWPAHSTLAGPVIRGKDSDMAGRDGIVPVLSTERIDELRSNLAPDTFAELIEECLCDMDRRLPALRQAVVAGAPAAIAAHAHAMIGMAAGYGMSALESRLRAVLASARNGEATYLDPAIIGRLESDFAEAARTLREMLRSEVV